MIKKIVVLDVETTGLDPTRHEMLQIGAIVVDPITMEHVASVDIEVQPEHLQTADPKALEINHYHPGCRKNEKKLRHALILTSRIIKDATLCGHNIKFDLGFLEAGYKECGLRMPKMDYHTIDTASLAWPLYQAGKIESLSLSSLAGYLGITHSFAHDAFHDAYTTWRVLSELTHRFGRSL